MEVNQFPGFHSNIPSGCHDAFFFQLLEKCLLSQELVYTHQFHVRRDHLHFLSLYNVLDKIFKNSLHSQDILLFFVAQSVLLWVLHLLGLYGMSTSVALFLGPW